MAIKTVKKKEAAEEVISFVYRGEEHVSKIVGQLILRDMSLVEIKDRLNDIPGKYAYWKSMQVTVEREVSELEEAFNIWHAEKYVSEKEALKKGGDAKPTEGNIKNMILLNNVGAYRTQMNAIRELQEVVGKIGVLTRAYDMQSWTLRTIASLTARELDNIDVPMGKRNIKDLGGKG